MKLAKLAMTAGLLLIGTTAMGSGPQVKTDGTNEKQKIQNPRQLIFESSSTYKVFDHTIDLWHDAVLKGDQKQANFYFDELNDIVIEDIQASKLQMKMLVRQIEHLYRENSAEGENLLKSDRDESEIDNYKQYLPILSSGVLIKEELSRAMNRTDAFSNKYRLLGDYKNLLRRELELPRLKMADLSDKEPKQAQATK